MMAPTLPDKVEIGPHVYEIRTDDESLRQLREDSACGDSRPDRLVVRVDIDLPHTSAAETTLHEMLHCCFHQTPMRVSDVSEHEEEIVTALAPRILDMLRSNPELVKYLTA